MELYNPAFIDIYTLKEIISTSIVAEEIKLEKHRSFLDSITNDISCFVAITQMTGIRPLYFCPKGLDFLNLQDLNFKFFSHDFFVKILHSDNWSMIPAGINHFRKTPEDLFPMSFKVKKKDTEWVNMYGASCSLYDILPHKGDITLTVLFEEHCLIDMLIQKNSNNSSYKMSPEEYKKFLMLTPQEKMVLKLLSQEYSNFEIAEQLCMSEHTINSYRKRLMKKLEVKSIVGLVSYVYKFGL